MACLLVGLCPVSLVGFILLFVRVWVKFRLFASMLGARVGCYLG